MSYCRWSSNDYQCDVYVWEDSAGGWRTEVAGRRHRWLVPLPEPVTLPIGEAGSEERTAWAEAWAARSAALNQLLDDETAWEWLDLPTPNGGHSYWHDTAAECADNLERLRAEGFNVPQYAIDSLRADHREDRCLACDGPIDRTLPDPIPDGYECMRTEQLTGRANYCQACYDREG